MSKRADYYNIIVCIIIKSLCINSYRQDTLEADISP